jgi:mono/diheme cytochrome c family protein
MTRAVLAALAFAVGCGGSCGLDLERMIDQPRYTTYEACDICPEGTIMMQPPEGTVSRTAQLGPSAMLRGRTGAAYADRIPIELDRQVLVRGRNRFDMFCAACHGRSATGISQVAENMTLRRPPNLLAAPYTTYPPGRIYAVINEGFGLMRSYAPQLSVADRWAVVAYVQALQLSQHVALGELPASIQQEARRWLK